MGVRLIVVDNQMVEPAAETIANSRLLLSGLEPEISARRNGHNPDAGQPPKGG